jgi:Zn-dependent metalloprotease
MKNSYAFLVITFLFVMLQASQPLMAQHAFDVKMKKNPSVNTSSLGAVQINGSSINKTIGRSVSVRTGQPGAFLKQSIQPRTKKVFFNPETGLPSFVISARDNHAARIMAKKDIQVTANEYLQELKPQLQIKRPDVGFSIRHSKTDQHNNMHVRLNQHYKNIPVYGAEVVLHFNASGEGESFNGNYYAIEADIDVVPALSKLSAVEKVNGHLSRKTPLHPLTSDERKLVQYEQPEATLCIYQDKGLVKTFVLAYHVVACPSVQHRWEYFVDAVTGNILHQFESTCSADGPATTTAVDLNGASQTVKTYLKGSTYFMVDTSRPMFSAAGSVLPDEPVGGIMTIDMKNTFGANASVSHVTSASNTWGSAKTVSAHFNAGVAYEYFRTKHSRNSIDGNGGTIYSIVNVPDENGQPLDNAFWNGKFISYGNGNTAFKSMAGSLDVAGHEMTHGVVENTANLEYQGESGAINESMADIFGSMMDPADWLIGEDIVKLSAFPSGALRSLSDPHNGGTSLANTGFQPSHTNEAYHGSEDNGGVHINSGIPNHAFYRYATAITRDKAAAVFYKALDDYLTKSSKFIDLRLAVIKAAADLYGASSNEATQAGIAFDAVGIGSGQAGNYTEVLAGNPGTEFLLVYNTNTGDANTLYRSSLDGTNGFALSQTTFISRPSVTDDGTVAVFVGSDNKIHAIHTTPGSTKDEVILQDQAIWSNVVISKGGTKLAAVTTAATASIHVYDFASESWAEFALYNPTYSDVSSSGPVYADALEWDYTGEMLVYDCFNTISNTDGADIEYWDVNFIRVWDNELKDFSDGTIAKLFSSLPDGVSIGNPSFSKNSPNIIAFDYFDVEGDAYAILGCNIETNEVNVITSNNTLGWPTFDKNDSRIAFTSLDGSDYNTNYIVLNSDKISSGQTAVGMFSNAKWPVYFAVGDRVIGDEVVTGIAEEKKKTPMACFPTSVTDQVSVMSEMPLLPGSRVELINSLGQKIYSFVPQPSGEEAIILNLENIKTGYYLLRVSDAKSMGTCRIAKH